MKKTNDEVVLTIPQATSDTRHGIVKMIKRRLVRNPNGLIDGKVLIAKILKMDERAKLKPGGEGQRRTKAKQ